MLLTSSMDLFRYQHYIEMVIQVALLIVNFPFFNDTIPLLILGSII